MWRMNVDQLGNDDDDTPLSESAWKSIADHVIMQDNQMLGAMGHPQGRKKSRKRHRQEAKRLHENRMKFLDSWVAAFNSGSSKAMEQFMMTWLKPDVVYREQLIHFVPQTLLYREIHSSRLLFQYTMALMASIPDVVYVNMQQSLKTKRDGRAYVISTVRVVGNYTFRLLTTNASSNVSQFLTQANPLRAVINNDHLLNRALFKSLLRGQQQCPSYYVSSIPAVYHPFPVEYDAVNGVLISRGLAGIQRILLPAFEGYENAASSLTKSSIYSVNESDLVNFDDEDLFQQLYQALLAPDDEDVDDDAGNVSDDEQMPDKRVVLLEDGDRDLVMSNSSSSSDSIATSSLPHNAYTPQRIAPSTLSATRPPSWLPPTADSTVARSEEDALRDAQRNVVHDQQRAADTLRKALTLIPPPSTTSDQSALPAPNIKATTARSTNNTPREERTRPSSSFNNTGNVAAGVSSIHNLPDINPTPQPLSIYDFIKVSTPYTQFFALEKLPRQYRLDFHQTMILYFAMGSDQVHRIDVYKKIA